MAIKNLKKKLYLISPKSKSVKPSFLGAPVLRRLRLAKDPKQRVDLFFSFHEPSVFKGFGSEWMPISWWLRDGISLTRLKFRVLRLHKGQRWRRIFVSRWHSGQPWGSFARTRTLAVFKKKMTERKQKRKNKQLFQPQGFVSLKNLKINQIREVKTGQRRKTHITFSKKVKFQFENARV